jgi:hypothetical protein
MTSLYKTIVAYLTAGILFYAFFDAIFKINPWATIMFVVSCGLAFYRGAVLRDPRLIAYIAIANIITNALTTNLAPQIWNDIVEGSLFSTGTLATVFLAVYLRARQLADYPEKRGSLI